MPQPSVPAAAEGCPKTTADDLSALGREWLEITPAGQAYLLLKSLLGRSHMQGNNLVVPMTLEFGFLLNEWDQPAEDEPEAEAANDDEVLATALDAAEILRDVIDRTKAVERTPEGWRHIIYLPDAEHERLCNWSVATEDDIAA